MGYRALHVEMSYEYAQMLPESDSISINYEHFKETFGQDGAVMFLGIEDNNIYTLEYFKKWQQLGDDIQHMDGVEQVLSIARLYTLSRNDSLKKFDFRPLYTGVPQSQTQLDSIITLAYSFPVYDGVIFNKKTGATFMAITLDGDKIDSPERIKSVEKIKDRVLEFETDTDIKTHISGMPYIRTVTRKKIKTDLILFVFLAAIVASIALYLFFRSIRAVLFPMTIVGISVIFGLGLLDIFNYEITILSGIIPPLMIIIGVENCIFLLNKYHQEYRKHGNKILALSRMVQRVGNATLMTNITTAIGFAAFILTNNKMLVEFGIVASINILIVFLLSIVLIPILFSFVSDPSEKDLKHLENKATYGILKRISYLVLNYRNQIYLVSGVFLIFGIYGITTLKTTGSVVDDIPHKDAMYQDLLFFEDQLNGLLPFEITVDTKKPRGVLKLSNLNKLQEVYDVLSEYPELSKPYSPLDIAKVAKQAYYNGKEEYYTIPNNQEKNFIMKYIPNVESGGRSALNNLVDEEYSIARIMVHIKNIGTNEISRIRAELQNKIETIFPPDKYETIITGTSVVFIKGTDYLINNLKTSLLIAIIAITILMIFLFQSFKMVSISLIPNLFPLVLTAALMSFSGTPIKASTIIVFSIALGISVDNTIHFLSRYRMELKLRDNNIVESVKFAINDMGFSIIYSSIVLFFGFGIFIFSSFGGTQALGFLVPFTLLIAVLANLIVLPSLLLTLNKWITTKAFKKEPFMEIFDEEEDIDTSKMKIEDKNAV